MKKYTFFIIAIIFSLTSCELEENPVTSVSKDAIFSSTDGLKTYSYSFYNIFPTGIDLHYLESSLVDYGATNSISDFVYLNAYSETSSSGWTWTGLRNINYFIANCTDNSISEDVRNNYIGIARFFRAYFYYDKVKKFGNVPWIDKPLDVNDEELYAASDSRELVMENVYKDLQFACDNITTTNDATGSLVTKWVAYALASRVSLFEGTYRKYHNLSLTTSADTWLKRAAESAEYIMINSGKSLYTADGTKKSYRDLFISNTPITSEILLAVCSSESLGIYHDANWKWTSATYGSRLNFIRPFINTYLQLDGTPYTKRSGWEKETFYKECQNRDYRLAQTIRTPGYTRKGIIALPDFAGYARLGYQPLKFCVDATDGDTKTLNTNALPLFRYAEVLLNYAEAKAELGTLTDENWAKTIGALRKRSGITGGISTKPTVVDEYLQKTYFSSVLDPVILEIRRERSIELALEGFRFDDLKRWHCGDLLKMSWYGMYIPELNTALDMDNNGTPDVIYYTSSQGLADAKAAIDWNTYSSTCATVSVSTDPSSSNLQVHEVEAGTPSAGYYLTWDTKNDSKRVWGNKQYLYPIPSLVMVKNPNIIQNPGWENGATNDGN
ncbi:MAG: RagB/SusD family nutrient uptake outer membrane protein [Bacteroidales bacterium]|nr:RagB/SusD family nutrient uptake outer membrane protein [Bacteroidales bacterium]